MVAVPVFTLVLLVYSPLATHLVKVFALLRSFSLFAAPAQLHLNHGTKTDMLLHVTTPQQEQTTSVNDYLHFQIGCAREEKKTDSSKRDRISSKSLLLMLTSKSW